MFARVFALEKIGTRALPTDNCLMIRHAVKGAKVQGPQLKVERNVAGDAVAGSVGGEPVAGFDFEFLLVFHTYKQLLHKDLQKRRPDRWRGKRTESQDFERCPAAQGVGS